MLQIISRAVLVLVCLLTSLALGQDRPAIVANVKVVSDKVEDVSSLQAWREAVIKPDMTDQQKALAAWEAAVKFIHHDAGPGEYSRLDLKSNHDFIKMANVYGTGRGPAAQTALVELARFLGFRAEGRSLNRFGALEIYYDGGWHYFDPGMICYFLREDGTVASMAEIKKEVGEWYDAHPDYPRGDVPKLREFLKEHGVKGGPKILQRGPTMNEKGSYTLNYFGWYSTMLVFDGSNNTPGNYEETYTSGYRVNIELSPGEKLIRNWGHQNLHVNMHEKGKPPETLNMKVGEKALSHTPKMGDLSNSRIGNGRVEYEVPLASERLKEAALVYENLAPAREKDRLPILRVVDNDKAGVLVLRRPSSYVYLTGKIEADARVGEGGKIEVEFSDNHGMDWEVLASITSAGKQEIDLSSRVLRRYEYRLRFTMHGAGTGLNALNISNDIQQSQRALPALGAGENTITFTAGPQEGTISIEPGSIKFKDKQNTIEDYHAQLVNIDMKNMEEYGTIRPAGESGSITFPIETPRDMRRLRFGCNYRARGEEDGWEYQVSFDEGKTFKTVDRTEAPVFRHGKFIEFAEIPPGTRKALVRFSGKQKNDATIFAIRIDADFKYEPGFAPVRITYQWEENGQPKEHIHIAKTPKETYSIRTEAKPTMKSIAMELAE